MRVRVLLKGDQVDPAVDIRQEEAHAGDEAAAHPLHEQECRARLTAKWFSMQHSSGDIRGNGCAHLLWNFTAPRRRGDCAYAWTENPIDPNTNAIEPIAAFTHIHHPRHHHRGLAVVVLHTTCEKDRGNDALKLAQNIEATSRHSE